MRLATSINLVSFNKETGKRIACIESIRRCAAVGFRVFDMNFAPLLDEDYILKSDDWEKKIYELANEAAKIGVEFSQSHAPFHDAFYDPRTDDPELYNLFEEAVRRSFYASKILGVKWITMHCFTDIANNCEVEASKKLNYYYFAKHLELAKKLGVGIALENMADLANPLLIRRFFATYEEIVDFVDSFNDPSIGVCWDFGHANRMKYKNQEVALRYIGKRLKSTHVNDNIGATDMHTAPFLGNINWEPIMKALSDIGYEGDFTYEIHGFTNGMPDVLKDSAIKLAFDIGQYLVGLSYKN